MIITLWRSNSEKALMLRYAFDVSCSTENGLFGPCSWYQKQRDKYFTLGKIHISFSQTTQNYQRRIGHRRVPWLLPVEDTENRIGAALNFYSPYDFDEDDHTEFLRNTGTPTGDATWIFHKVARLKVSPINGCHHSRSPSNRRSPNKVNTRRGIASVWGDGEAS